MPPCSARRLFRERLLARLIERPAISRLAEHGDGWGVRLAHYRITAALGVGGMGAVYRGLGGPSVPDIE